MYLGLRKHDVTEYMTLGVDGGGAPGVIAADETSYVRRETGRSYKKRHIVLRNAKLSLAFMSDMDPVSNSDLEAA